MGKKIEEALRQLPLNDELKSYIRLKIGNPSVQDEERDAILSRTLFELQTGGTECIKAAVLDLYNSFSARTKSFKQTFIEKNPGILVWEVESYLAILERHARGKRDTKPNKFGKMLDHRKKGIEAALDEIARNGDEELLAVIQNNRANWLSKDKYRKCLPNMACDIFAEKHGFAYDRAVVVYRDHKPQTPIAETGNRIASPGYRDKDFKLIPNKGNILRNCQHSIFLPLNPETITTTRNKGPLPSDKAPGKTRRK